MENLTKSLFDQKIKNFSFDKDWKFAGSKPIIIDFYAGYCSPCKILAPVLEQLQAEYGNKIEICKVDTEEEMELPGMFGIRSVPTLMFFVPGEPYFMKVGALPKVMLEKIIKEQMKVEK